jgi:hypothetical protein
MPALPSLRALTADLRELHAAWAHPDAGGEYVRLVFHIENNHYEWLAVAAGQVDSLWIAHVDHKPNSAMVYGWEFIPGDGARFDAVAAARRLLAAAREGLKP